MPALRLIAIMPTFNEERVIAASLEHLIRQGAGVYLLDNQSTDRTVAIANRFLGHGLIEIMTVPRSGVFDWADLLAREERLAATLEADWFVHQGADEFLQPWRPGQTLAQALAEVDAQGDNAVDFYEFTFVPTREAPDHDHPYFEHTMRWYYPHRPDQVSFMRAWKKQPGPLGLVESAGHRLQFTGMRLHPRRFCLRHYICLSVDHAVRKYVQRQYSPAEVQRGWHGWRARLQAESIQLPAQAELSVYAGDGQFDTSRPRSQHFLAKAVAPLPARDNRIVCIAGMHRSGTSMVARLLNLAGLYLGTDSELMRADQHNQDGYWEHTGFVAVNDALLSAFGGGWDVPPDLTDDWDLAPALLPVRAQAAGLLQQFAGQAYWGWKDPRTLLTWRFWKRLIPNLKLVVCVRHPLEVAESLRQRGASSTAFGLQLWLESHRRLLAETRPADRIVTHYGSYFYDARAELRRLLDLLQVSVSPADIDRAVQAVSPALRHCALNTADLLQPEVSDSLLEMYATVCAEAGPVYHRLLTQEPERAEQPAATALSPTQVEYATAVQMARLRGQIEAARDELSQLRARSEQVLSDLAAHLQQKDQALGDLAAQLQQKDQALGDLAAQLQQKDQALGDLAAQLQQKDQALGDLTAQLQQKDQALGDLAAQLQQKDLALGDLTGQLQQKDQALGELSGQLQQKDLTLADLSAQLQHKDQALADLTTQLQQTGETRDQLVAQLQQNDRALGHLTAQSQQTDQLVSRLAAELTGAQRALNVRDASLAEQERALTRLTTELGGKERTLAEADHDRIAFENRAQRLQAELATIEHSRAWGLVLRWYKLRFELRRLGSGSLAPARAAAAPSVAPEPASAPPAPGDSPPTILFVAHDAHRHGAQILLLHLLRWLKQNTDIRFEILLKADGELQADFESLAPLAPWPAAQALLDHCRQANVQLVYSNTITNGDALEVLSQLHCPIICHVHELDFWINNRTEPGNNRSVKAHTTHYIAVAQAVKESLVRNLDIPAERIDVIYEFVPTRAIAGQVTQAAAHIRQQLSLPAEALVIGAAGTTDWRKGADLFLQLARAVVARAPGSPVHFVWLGGDQAGAAFAPLQHDLSHLGLDDRVHFVGARPNPLDYLAVFDVFVLVSREDPFPLVNLEAASLGKPLVCFAGAGGAPEFVETDSGFVVPYLDIDTMADRCLELLRSPELRQRLGQRAAEKACQRHDVDVIGPQVARLLRRFLQPVSVS